jgi:hypothetical protein
MLLGLRERGRALSAFAKKLTTQIRPANQNQVFRTSRSGRTNRSGWSPSGSRSSEPKPHVLAITSDKLLVAQGAAPSAGPEVFVISRSCVHNMSRMNTYAKRVGGWVQPQRIESLNGGILRLRGRAAKKGGRGKGAATPLKMTTAAGARSESRAVARTWNGSALCRRLR